MPSGSGLSYYAMQVRTRGEEKFIRQARSLCRDSSISLYFPQRCLDIRKGGTIKPSKLAIFPGYVFLGANEDEDNVKRFLWIFRRIDSFYRFLRSNRDIVPLQKRDLELVLHFIKTGPVAGKSKVYFDENSRIVVLSGPLSGLEGKIIKVDRRKKRAKIVLDLYDESFSIDLAFEVIEIAKTNND